MVYFFMLLFVVLFDGLDTVCHYMYTIRYSGSTVASRGLLCVSFQKEDTVLQRKCMHYIHTVAPTVGPEAYYGCTSPEPEGFRVNQRVI